MDLFIVMDYPGYNVTLCQVSAPVPFIILREENDAPCHHPSPLPIGPDMNVNADELHVCMPACLYFLFQVEIPVGRPMMEYEVVLSLKQWGM